MLWLKTESTSIRFFYNDVEWHTIPKLSGLYQEAFISCSQVCRWVWFGQSKLHSAGLFCMRLQVSCALLQVRTRFRSGSHVCLIFFGPPSPPPQFIGDTLCCNKCLPLWYWLFLIYQRELAAKWKAGTSQSVVIRNAFIYMRWLGGRIHP